MCFVQVECDAAGGRIIARFIEARRLQNLVRDASSRRGGNTGRGGSGSCVVLMHFRISKEAINQMLHAQLNTVMQPMQSGWPHNTFGPQTFSTLKA